LRLRPARRAALTMTLMRAECSMISAGTHISTVKRAPSCRKSIVLGHI
jgi:hypothetical protein